MYERLLLFLLLTLPLFTCAQLAVQPRISPLSIATARFKDSYLKITYSQPHKQHRELFGALVPYGQVWRTGANEATEITLTKDILVEGQKLKAGTYSIFTIPNQTTWTIIFNNDLGLWGSYNYNQKTDALRFDVPSEVLIQTVYEPFTILIDQKTDKATLSLLWDKTKVSFSIQFIETK
jgi:hypothetical protein